MSETTVSYKCLNCGAPLNFLPGDTQVTCEFCAAKFDIAALEAQYAKQEEKAAAVQAMKEEKWDTTKAGSEWSEAEAEMMKAFTCSSCGAEIVSDGNTMATECCYCGNPTMLPSRFDGILKPDFVIPFKKTKKDAMEALAQFYQGKALLPDSFTANNRVEDIQAMYVPFWLFDTEIKAAASYRATKQNVVKTEEETITTTHHYACERAGKMSFKAIPVDGSEKMNDTYMESIEPFDYSELTPFSTAYLTGYLADKYDVDAEKAVLRADERIASSAEECLRDTVNGYATVKQEGGTIINKGESSVSYAMVPVWILTTRFEDEPYTFMMNGQIGKVVGSLPIDNGKLRNQTILTFIIIFLLAFAATSFGMKQGGAPFRMDEVTLGIALAITLLGTWLRRSSLIASMSNVRDASSANAYLEKDKFDLTLHDDTYLFSNTVVTKRQQKEKG